MENNQFYVSEIERTGFRNSVIYQWNCASDDHVYWAWQMHIFFGMANVALWYAPMKLWEELHFLADLAIIREQMAWRHSRYGIRQSS